MKYSNDIQFGLSVGVKLKIIEKKTKNKFTVNSW